jgi:hypothetical protein
MFGKALLLGTGESSVVQDTFTSNGTWSCCPGMLCARIVAVGGGGGGGAGAARGIVDATRNDKGVAGGAGGGAGGVVVATLTAAELTSTVCVVIGSAGAGGSGVGAVPWPGSAGIAGTNGGDTCFGGFLIARGGKGPSANSCPNVDPGGVSACPGLGGTGSIFCGTGTVYTGGTGGGMNANCYSDINGLPAANVSTNTAPGAGAGGSMWYCNGTTYCGTGGDGDGQNSVFNLNLGASGKGGNAPSTCAIASAGYGAGGAGSAANGSTCSCNAANGRPGIVRVVQYF